MKTTTHYFEVEITETACNRPGEESEMFNRIAERFSTHHDVKEFLVARYDKIPTGKRKIYVDKDGGRETIGFTHSFWNRDISHNAKNWYQTDWVIVSEITEESKPVLFN